MHKILYAKTQFQSIIDIVNFTKNLLIFHYFRFAHQLRKLSQSKTDKLTIEKSNPKKTSEKKSKVNFLLKINLEEK